MTREMITLTQEEQRRVTVLSEVREGQLTTRDAAELLGLSLRHTCRVSSLERLDTSHPLCTHLEAVQSGLCHKTLGGGHPMVDREDLPVAPDDHRTRHGHDAEAAGQVRRL